MKSITFKVLVAFNFLLTVCFPYFEKCETRNYNNLKSCLLEKTKILEKDINNLELRYIERLCNYLRAYIGACVSYDMLDKQCKIEVNLHWKRPFFCSGTPIHIKPGNYSIYTLKRILNVDRIYTTKISPPINDPDIKYTFRKLQIIHELRRRIDTVYEKITAGELKYALEEARKLEEALQRLR